MVECIDYFYRLFCLAGHADLLLAQARRQFITDPEELDQSHRRRAQMFRECLFERKSIKKKKMWEMRQSKELDFPEPPSILRELCTFDTAADSFLYTSHGHYPDTFFKFTLNSNLDVKELLNLGFDY